MALPYLTSALIPLRAEAVPTESYKAAIFFDNDYAKIVQVTTICPQIKGITVPETPGTSGPGGSSSLIMKHISEPLKTIISESGGADNLYIKVAIANGVDDEQYDPVSGISSVHIEQLTNWLAETASQTPRVILFDWDRTITKVEGVLLPSPRNPRAPISSMMEILRDTEGKSEADLIEDKLKVICGGPARLAMIRDMFNTITDSGAHVIILTNNDSCFTASFKQLVNGLVPKPGPPVFLACSKNPPFFGDKGRRLIALPVFKLLCGAAGAGGGAGGGPSRVVPILVPVTAPISRSSSPPPRTRRFVNMSGNNEEENLYSGGRRKSRRATRKSRRATRKSRRATRKSRRATKKTRRGKDRKN